MTRQTSYTTGRGGRGKSELMNRHKMEIPSQIDKIIREADIILEVLDSRFIEKTRNPELEDKVKKLGKLLIYIFNKSDLVDMNKIMMNTDVRHLTPNLFLSTKDRKSAFNLKRFIKIESKKLKKDSVSIGVIGYQNSGKSSLINLLTRRGAAKTSSEAGYTKGIKKIRLSPKLYLIDTPGIIPTSEKYQDNRENLIKNSEIGAITWDRARDPDMIVSNLMSQYPGLIEKYYGIDANGNSEVLMEKLGRKLSFLRKGNLVDEIRTAKKILKDWQEGKIRAI